MQVECGTIILNWSFLSGVVLKSFAVVFVPNIEQNSWFIVMLPRPKPWVNGKMYLGSSYIC